MPQLMMLEITDKSSLATAINLLRQPQSAKCISIIERMQLKHQIEGIILGCTEFPILIPSKELRLPSFDTTGLHVKLALQEALSEELLKK